MVDELLDEFAKLAPEDVTVRLVPHICNTLVSISPMSQMYCNRVAEAVAKELSKGRGKGKEKA